MPRPPSRDAAPSSAGPASPALNEADACARIWAVVARIPHGRVATYGQIAAEAGLLRRARLAGYALRHAPEALALPWHRVLNAQGRISLPAGSTAAARQRERLQAEGVELVNGRVDLKRYRWQPRSDAPLLD